MRTTVFADAIEDCVSVAREWPQGRAQEKDDAGRLARQRILATWAPLRAWRPENFSHLSPSTDSPAQCATISRDAEPRGES
jgi:hypothetical protein